MTKVFSFLALFIMSFQANAMSDGQKIANALQSSNATEISNMFNTSLEMLTPSGSGIMAKEQARMVLDNFLKSNVPVKATVLHETTGTSNSMIVISLQTKNGVYRVTVSGTIKSGAFIINQFKITS